MADTIQEYLVRLGFQVDQSQQNRFSDGLKSVRTQMEGIEAVVSKSISGFMELATAAGGTAIAIATALGKIALGMAQMSFQAQKVGASADNIHALGFAFTQAGGSIEDANSALESYASLLLRLPGQEQAVKQQFGIAENVTDRAEQLVQAFAVMRQRIETSGPEGSLARSLRTAEQLNIAIGQLGATEDQFRKGIRPQFNPAFAQARETEGRVGVNWDEAARKGAEYRKTLTDIYDEFSNLKTFVYNEFADGMNTGLRKVADFLKTHDTEIAGYLRNMRVNFDAVTTAIGNWYDSLSKEQQGQVKAGAAVAGGAGLLLGGGAALGGLLNFFRIPGATQIARLGVLTAAIGLLTNDYMTWKRTEGQGDSGLIDWKRWEPAINAASSAITALNNDVIGPLADKLGLDRAFIPAFEGLAAYLLGGAFLGALKTGIGGLLRMLMFIPGSGVTAGVLAALGIGAVAVAVSDAEAGDMASRFGLTPDKIDEFGHPMGYKDTKGNYYSNQEVQSMSLPPRSGGAGGGATADRMAEIRDALAKDLNITPDAASGLVSNANAESGLRGINEINPTVPGSRGGFGWLQWTGPRRLDFEAWAKAKGLDPASDEANYGFLIHELTTKYPQVLAQLRRGNITAQEAANVVMRQYVIPPDTEKNRQSHTAAAQAIANIQHTGTTPPPATAATIVPPVIDSAKQAAPGVMDRVGEWWKGVNKQWEGKGLSVAPTEGMTTPPPPPPAVVPEKRPDVSFNSSPNITVNGVSDPQLAANYVERASERQNADVLRRLRPVYA